MYVCQCTGVFPVTTTHDTIGQSHVTCPPNLFKLVHLGIRSGPSPQNCSPWQVGRWPVVERTSCLQLLLNGANFCGISINRADPCVRQICEVKLCWEILVG